MAFFIGQDGVNKIIFYLAFTRDRPFGDGHIALKAMRHDHGNPLSHAIAANHRPALEDLLVCGLPRGIISPERQPRINHQGPVGVVL
jgi:hypothetical protein